MCISSNLVSQTMYQLFLRAKIGPLDSQYLSKLNQRHLRKLLDYRYIYGDHNNQVQITDLGYEFVSDIERHPDAHIRDAKWKDEALTGITVSGQETRIKNAAIPCDKPPPYDPNDPPEPEDMDTDPTEPRHIPDVIRYIELKSRFERIASRFNKTLDQIVELAADDRIAWCPGCRQYSIFDRDKTKPNGLKPHCRSCRNH